MEGTATKTLRSLLERIQPDPKSGALVLSPKESITASTQMLSSEGTQPYPALLYKISPTLTPQQSPTMVQSPTLIPSPTACTTQQSTANSDCTVPSSMHAAKGMVYLDDVGIRRTRTVIPYTVKCQIAKVANQIPRMTQGEIAQMFGIDRTTVSKILKRRREFEDKDDEGPTSKSIGMTMLIRIRHQI